MDLENLSADAQALAQTLSSAAESAAQVRGRGYAMIHEDQVGGADRVAAAIAELNEAGITVRVSAGEFNRMIQLVHPGGQPVSVSLKR